uniref:hypothetical protein n=1 Tax=Faecalibacterium sp. TaxID=1971605 RepID=UPI004024E232
MKEIGKTRPYRILAGMKQRCANPANIHYANYGGRGITVCNEWLGRDGAEAFYEWAVTHGYRDDLTIDRIDNDLGYSPSNCAWMPQTVNNSSNNLRVKLWYIIRCVPQFEADYLLPLIAKVENETDRNFLMKEFRSAQKKQKQTASESTKKPGRITCIRAGDGVISCETCSQSGGYGAPL